MYSSINVNVFLLSILILQFVPDSFPIRSILRLAESLHVCFHIVHSIFLYLHSRLPVKMCSKSTLVMIFSSICLHVISSWSNLFLTVYKSTCSWKVPFVLNCLVIFVKVFAIHMLSILNLLYGYKYVFVFLSWSTNHDFPLCTWAFLSIALWSHCSFLSVSQWCSHFKLPCNVFPIV